MEKLEIKRGELMVEKMKRAPKRDGNSTPSPTWKFGSFQPDGALIPDYKISPNSRTISARRLGANLWEMEPHFSHRVAKLSRISPVLPHRGSEEEAQAVKNVSKQEITGDNVRKHLEGNVTKARQPLYPASFSSSKELPPYGSEMSPNCSLLSKFGESGRGIKTSTELLKVLNRIWSLEEKHALDMSLVKTLNRELEESKACIQELMQEKKRDKNEVNSLMKQLRVYKVDRRKDQEKIRDTIRSMEVKLEEEMKLRRKSEKRHQKLAMELSEIQRSFSDALREVEQERKARVMLEDLCDAFAKGIRDYEQEIRAVKNEPQNDRLILHISEAWLDERKQLKLADVSEKQSVLDKLCHEVECFLRKKQDVSPKSRGGSHSLESFHLNEPASAPWNATGDDSIGISLKAQSIDETSNPRFLRKGETTQRSSHEGRNLFDRTMFTGPPSPVKKWNSDVESSSKLAKTSTLKAKLMEARQERQQSRGRISESPLQGD